jgi:thiol-disulfide isomerase/thioredoxin
MRFIILFFASMFLLHAPPASAQWSKYQFSLKTSEGVLVTNENYSNRLIFMEIWATWCAPCIAGFPVLQKLHDEFAKSPSVAVLTVHYGSDYGVYGSAASFKKATGFKFPILQDPNGILTKKLNRLPFFVSVPKYILFGTDGRIIKRYGDLDAATVADVRRRFINSGKAAPSR